MITKADIIAAALEQTPNGYKIGAMPADAAMIAEIVNQGIDAHLEGFTRSTFPDTLDAGGRLNLVFHPEELHILIRRLEETGMDTMVSFASDICRTLDLDPDEMFDWE